jgi:hypothetical protein
MAPVDACVMAAFFTTDASTRQKTYDFHGYD